MVSNNLLSESLPEGIAIRTEALSKSYRIYKHPRDRLLQGVWGRDRWGRPKQFYREFWALQELNFQLALGETLGVVGRNGSGKSTLLQLLCGTLSPTTGRVEVRGRVAALLELGSGFNPEFTGLENVFLNASLLGLSQAETEERLDKILGFADIGDFINQAVKTYSSGMAVRLAFAVQAHVDPDVLVVDEALAVGDELFQKKCYAHLERLKERGTAVLLVTHSCPAIIQHCDQALLLHRGKARMLGEPSKVTVTYQRLINASDDEWDSAFSTLEQATKDSAARNSINQEAVERVPALPHPDSRTAWLDTNLKPQSSEIYPAHGAEIIDAWIEQASSGARVNVLPFGEDFVLCFSYRATESLHELSLACHIANHTGQRISGQAIPVSAASNIGQGLLNFTAGEEWLARYSFKGGLWPGLYFIGGGIISHEKQESSKAAGKRYIHRVVDFRALRILDQDGVNVIGSCSLRTASPQLRRSQTQVPAGT